jgi:hypothetical protein
MSDIDEVIKIVQSEKEKLESLLEVCLSIFIKIDLFIN